MKRINLTKRVGTVKQGLKSSVACRVIDITDQYLKRKLRPVKLVGRRIRTQLNQHLMTVD